MKLSQRSVDHVVRIFAKANVGDPRRTRRMGEFVGDLARRPSVSLPAALGSDAKVQGAYRLINNPAVTFDSLVQVQAQATRKRAEEARRVYVLHDTTDCSFPHLDPAEIGYLQTGKAGFRAHLSLVVAADLGRPLGIVAAETVHRSKRRRRARKDRVSGSETTRQKDREYERWPRGVESSSKLLKNCECIHVADREGDSFELLYKLLAANQGLIIRVRVDRRARKVDATSDEWSKVRAVAAGLTGMLERQVPLSRRKAKTAPGMNQAHPPRKMRMAKLSFAATRVEIPRPVYFKDPVPKTLAINLVHVTELNPPTGEPAVEWLLYTTEPVGTPEQVEAVVDGYRIRWMIEEFNSALKTGCAYEARQFDSRHGLLTMLALSLPIAAEMLWLRSRARTSPDAPATEVLTAQQIQILRKLGSKKLPPRPTVGDALIAVAALGGHLKRNGDPGWKILQRGMALLLVYEVGWAANAASRRI